LSALWKGDGVERAALARGLHTQARVPWATLEEHRGKGARLKPKKARREREPEMEKRPVREPPPLRAQTQVARPSRASASTRLTSAASPSTGDIFRGRAGGRLGPPHETRPFSLPLPLPCSSREASLIVAQGGKTRSREPGSRGNGCKKNCSRRRTLLTCMCHPCAGAMLIFSIDDECEGLVC